MESAIVHSKKPVLLVGGAHGDNSVLEHLLDRCPTAVAADSGADWLLRAGRVPDAVIGDLDSISETALDQIPDRLVHRIAEQDSTDFDKCLRSIKAPLIFGAGFLGARLDHALAVLTVLVRYPHRNCVLVGESDLIIHLPPAVELDLPVGTRLSLYPMCRVTGRSKGLEWPIDGITFSPATRVGTSNRATGKVSLSMDGPGMLLILPASSLPVLAESVEQSGARWPAP